jgi:hypothetical protein
VRASVSKIAISSEPIRLVTISCTDDRTLGRIQSAVHAGHRDIERGEIRRPGLRSRPSSRPRARAAARSRRAALHVLFGVRRHRCVLADQVADLRQQLRSVNGFGHVVVAADLSSRSPCRLRRRAW